MISLNKILNRLYLTKFSFYLLLGLILISFSITFYLMLPNNNLVKNPLQLQYFLLADVFFVILLLALIIRQLILIIIYRRNQKDESKLYMVENGEEVFLPKVNIFNKYIFATENQYLLYPTNNNYH